MPGMVSGLRGIYRDYIGIIGELWDVYRDMSPIMDFKGYGVLRVKGDRPSKLRIEWTITWTII